MKIILFIRHGESLSNVGGITMDHNAVPLTERGHEQAKKLAHVLHDGEPSSKILVSPMLRARQTAEPYCRLCGVDAEIDPSLAEFSVIDTPLIEGMNGEQRKVLVKPYWDAPDPSRRLGQHADTFFEFNERVSAFMQKMNDLPDNTIVFGHGIWIVLLLWRLYENNIKCGGDMQAFREFQKTVAMPNCAVFDVINYKGDRWTPPDTEDLRTRPYSF